MLRLGKYLKQHAVWEHHSEDSAGGAKLDKYGQEVYKSPKEIRCRKEPYVQREQTGNGQFSNYTTTYYVVDRVTHSDKLDGHEVQDVQELVDGRGNLVGFEVHV